MPDRWGSKRKPSSSERKLMEQKSREQIVKPIGPGPPPTLDRNLGMGVDLGFRKIRGKMVWKALLLHSSW